MLRKYIKSLNLNKRNYDGIHQSTLTSARIKASRKYLREKRLIRLKRMILIFFLTLFVGILIYIVFFSSVFKIKNIIINKTVNYGLITEEEVKASLQDFINKSHNNLIFLKHTAWQREIIKDSRLASLDIKKKWFTKDSSIEINLEEEQPMVVLKILGDNQHYYLNKEGEVIKAYSTAIISAELGDNLGPIFYDQSKTNVKDENYINFLGKLLVFVQDNQALFKNNIHIERVNINSISNIFDVQIIAEEGWQILINSEVDLGKQSISLLQILEEEIEDRNNLEYIDLRFGDKMFYKFK